MPELIDELKTEYDIYKSRNTSHLHLKNQLTGIALTDAWTKLPLDTTNYGVKMFGGFSFDDANDRIYWDYGGTINQSLPATFIGDAGLTITAGMSATATVIMGLFIDEVLILETPMNFANIDKIQGYGANGILVDALDANLLQSGSSYDIRAKAGSGETPTVSMDYLNVTIKRD